MNSLRIPTRLLVIANSARMLSQLLVDAGFESVALDCFADEDTQALSLDSIRLCSLALPDIQAAAESMQAKYALTHLVYGSGFENHVESLRYLETRFTVLGNPADLFVRFQDKSEFFQQLTALAIAHPETMFSPPGNADDWLLKPMIGEGGRAIACYDSDKPVDVERFYWQRYLPGAVYSVLFVADARQSRVLGFNRQSSLDVAEECFLFSGVISRAHIPDRVRALLANTLNKLLSVYPLQGLGSLDFIMHNQQCYVLEINARIPASAQLYGRSVFNLHWQACLGVLAEPVSAPPAGYQIIYAENPLGIPSGLQWPKWVVDRPTGGAIIGKGQPVCSIIAAGNDADQVANQLRRQQIIIENFLKTGL